MKYGIIIIYLCISTLAVPALYGEESVRSEIIKDADALRRDEAKASVVTPKERAAESDVHEIYTITPRVRSGCSMTTALALDAVFPGGGHFYTGNTYTGFTFLALKVLGACSFYYYYMEWKYSRSLYDASKKANENLSED